MFNTLQPISSDPIRNTQLNDFAAGEEMTNLAESTHQRKASFLEEVVGQEAFMEEYMSQRSKTSNNNS